MQGKMRIMGKGYKANIWISDIDGKGIDKPKKREKKYRMNN